MFWKEYKLDNWKRFDFLKKIRIQNHEILLLELESFNSVPKEGSKNLISVSIEGNIQWIADLPKSYPKYAFYQDIRFGNNVLEAWCGSIYCVIDPLTGNIISEEFVR